MMRILNRLDLRLALAVLLGLAASGAALVAWQSHSARLAADAHWQGDGAISTAAKQEVKAK